MRLAVCSFVVGIVTVVTSCGSTHRALAQAQAPIGVMPSANTDSSHAQNAMASMSGTVVEAMNASSYTYVLVDDGAKKVWVAAPQFAVAVGDKVVVPDGTPMRNFQSKTLERTFEVVDFVAAVQVVVGGQAGNEPPISAHGGPAHGFMHPSDGQTAAAAAIDLSNIKKAAGGQTVVELFTNKATLVGKEVIVRGRVVKFTPNVMGTNWMHVQDGTGIPATNDLTVSTSTSAAVGNTVLVRGKLTTDKDLGFGYRYDVIVENATVAVE